MDFSLRWLRLSIAPVIVAGATALLPAVVQAEPPDGKLSTGQTFSNSAGTLGYELYVPASYKAGTPVPLVIALHGCTETAAAFRTLSHFDAVAAADGFIVAYPEQSTSKNPMRCWNFFTDANMKRGAGEPALIAGITKDLMNKYTVDPKRVFVTGLSAGAGMSTVMGTTYPDLYAAIGVGSGCEYSSGAACAGYKGDDPEAAGKRAYAAMGSYARPVPFLVTEGDQDTTVPPANADQVVRAQQVAADLSDDGKENGSVPTAPVKTVSGKASGGRIYTVKYYSDGHGHELGEYWMVQGMGHAWSGGDPAAQYADPAGPDESQAMYDFFATHAMGDSGPALGGGGPKWPVWPTPPGGFRPPSAPTPPPGWPTQPSGWPKPSIPTSPLPWPPHGQSNSRSKHA